MGNLDDYFSWRGDLSFDQVPINLIDSMIFSFFSYVDFEGIVTDEKISIEEISKKFFEKFTEEEILKRVSMIKQCPFLLKNMAKSERFKNLKVYNYKNRINVEKESQFSAICIDLTDNDVFICFRGTDDTLIGWKEDFNMSILKEIPSQVKAIKYLNEKVPNDKNLFLGGHSKGGNLAIYAACKCNQAIKDKIIKIYNHDGPGFTEEFVNSEDYLSMIDKVISVFPEESVIGRLFEHREKYIIVKSSVKFLLQHNPLSWEVLGSKFIEVNKFSNQSNLIQKSLYNLNKELSFEKKKTLITSVWNVFDTLNVKNVGDFFDLNIISIQGLIKANNQLTTDDKQLIMDVIKLFIKHNNEAKKEIKKETKKEED